MGGKSLFHGSSIFSAAKKKNNPLLLGDSGVGKTAIIEGLALKIVNGDVPPALKMQKSSRLIWQALLPAPVSEGTLKKDLKYT
ncbi:MAG: hypothetical protein H6925_06750 [Holosporaceae bacterium]|nr:MAG: hypothetical protein H6925_06750 [Holosporaceae bacterium]